jgi:hypothetical protein
LPIGIHIRESEWLDVEAATDRLNLEKQQRAHFTNLVNFARGSHGKSHSGRTKVGGGVTRH